MMRIALLLASAALQLQSIPAAASECSSVTELVALRGARAEIPRQGSRTQRSEATCRDYATSFYRVVLTRQAALACGVGRKTDLATLDSEIDALNELLATKCGG